MLELEMVALLREFLIGHPGVTDVTDAEINPGRFRASTMTNRGPRVWQISVSQVITMTGNEDVLSLNIAPE
jgi:hypothetical protein